MRKDDGGSILGFHSALESCVNLAVVMATAGQTPDFFIGHILDKLRGAGITVEEVLAHVGAVICLEGLEVTVGGVVHQVDECAVLVLLEQFIPFASPDDLDDGPAGTAEEGLQFLDDLGVTTHRAVEALQVAVDDEGQVVEVVESSLLDEAARLRLVHFAVTKERPDMLLRGVFDAAVV